MNRAESSRTEQDGQDVAFGEASNRAHATSHRLSLSAHQALDSQVEVVEFAEGPSRERDRRA